MHRSMKKKLVTTNGHCIRFLTITLVVIVNLSASIGRDWNHHDHKNGEIKWAPNCDFSEGHVIKKAKDVKQEECGSHCLDHPRCTHFTFMGNKCFLKEIELEAKVMNEGGSSRCGFVSRRGIIRENSKSTAHKYNSTNQHDENRQPKLTENSVDASSAPHHISNNSYSSVIEHSVLPSTLSPAELSSTSHESTIGSSASISKVHESSTEHQNSTTSSAHLDQISISSSSLKKETSNLQPTRDKVPSVSGPDQHEIFSAHYQIGNGPSRAVEKGGPMGPMYPGHHEPRGARAAIFLPNMFLVENGRQVGASPSQKKGITTALDPSQLRDDSLNASSTATDPVRASSSLNQASNGSSLQVHSTSPTIAKPTEAPHFLGEMGTSQHYSTPLSNHQKGTSSLNSINSPSIRHDQLIEHSSEPALHPIEANNFTNQSDSSFSSLLHQSNLPQPVNFSMNSSIHEQISRNHSTLNFNELNESSTVDPITMSAPNKSSSDHTLAGDHHSITSTMNPISTTHSSIDHQSNHSTTAKHVVNTSNSDHPISNSHSSFKEESNESSKLNKTTSVLIEKQDASTDQITLAPDHHNKESTISSTHFQATNDHSSVTVQQNIIPTINPSQTSYDTNQSSSTHSSTDGHSNASNFDSLIHHNPIPNSHSALNETLTAPSTVNPATISLNHNQVNNNHSTMQGHDSKTMTTTQLIQTFNDQSNTIINPSVDGHQLDLHPTSNTTMNSSIQELITSTLSSIKDNLPRAFSTLSQTTKSSDAHDQLENRSSLEEKGNLFSIGNQSGTSSNLTDQTSTSKHSSSQDSENQSSTAANLIDSSYIHEIASRTTSSLPNERNHTAMSTSSSIELSSPSKQANDSSVKSFSWDQSDTSSTGIPTNTSSTLNQSSTSASSLKNEPNPAFTENKVDISSNAASSTDNPTKLTSLSGLVSNKDESSILQAQTNRILSTPSVSGQMFTNPQLLEDHLNVSFFNNKIDIDSSVPPQRSTSRSQPSLSLSSSNNPIETSSVSQELTNQPQLTSTINASKDSSILHHDETKTTSYAVSSIRNSLISNQIEIKGQTPSLPDPNNAVSTLNPMSISSNPDQIRNDTYLSRNAPTQLPTIDSSKISLIYEETSKPNLTTTAAYSAKSVSLPEQIISTSQSDLSTPINPTNKNPSAASNTMVSSHSDWNIDENGQIKWSRECNYWGSDIQEKEGIPEEGCGRICLAIRKCTHFVWVEEGICFLKEFKKPVKEKRIQGTVARCGFVVHRQPLENPLQLSTERRLIADSTSTPEVSTLSSSPSTSSTPIEHPTKHFTSTVSSTSTSTSSIPSTTTLPSTTQQIMASTLPTSVMTSNTFFESTIADDQQTHPTSNSHRIIDEDSHDPSSLEWNIDLDGQIKWAKECDFNGQYAYDEEADVLEENCASVCLEDPKCTHFKWIDDFCFLKEIKKHAIARPNDMIPRCGFVVERKMTENPLVEVTSPATSTTYKTLFENKIDDDQQTSSTSKAHETITGKVIHDPYSSLDWNIDLDGQVKWAKDCNFNGHYAYDEEADVLEENCASVCLEDPKCTHFKWIDDFCFLKEIKKYAIAKHNDVVPRCGFIVNRQVTESPLEAAIRLFKLNSTTSTVKPSTSSASTSPPSTPETSTHKTTPVAETVKPTFTTTIPSTSSTATSIVPSSTSTSTSTTESTTPKQATLYKGVFSSKTRRTRKPLTANLGKKLQEQNGQYTTTSSEQPTTASSTTTSSSTSPTTSTMSQEIVKSKTTKHARTHGSTLLKLFDTELSTSTSTTPNAKRHNLEIVWKDSNCQIPGYYNPARTIEATFIYRRNDCAKKCIDHLSCVYFLYANYNCDLYESSPWNTYAIFEWRSAYYQECSCGIVMNREIITAASTTSSTTTSSTSTSTERTTIIPSTSTSTIPKSTVTVATSSIPALGSSSSSESGRAIKWKDGADCRMPRNPKAANQITIPDIDDCAERCLARASCLYFNMLDDPTDVCLLYESSPWEIPLKFEWKESRHNLRCGIIVYRDISMSSKLVPSYGQRSTDPTTSVSSTTTSSTSTIVARTTTTPSMSTTTTPPKTTITVTTSPSSTGTLRSNDLEISWKNNNCRVPQIPKPENRIKVTRVSRRDECAQKCLVHNLCVYFNHFDYSPKTASVCLLFDSSPWDIPLKFEWVEPKPIGYILSCGFIANRSTATAMAAKLIPSYDHRSNGSATSASSTTVPSTFTSSTERSTTSTIPSTSTSTTPRSTITATTSTSAPGTSSPTESRRNGPEINWKNKCYIQRTPKPENPIESIDNIRRDECAQKCLAHFSCVYFNHNVHQRATTLCRLFDSSPWDVPPKFGWIEPPFGLLSCGIIVNRSPVMTMTSKSAYDQRSADSTTSQSSTTASTTSTSTERTTSTAPSTSSSTTMQSSSTLEPTLYQGKLKATTNKKRRGKLITFAPGVITTTPEAQALLLDPVDLFNAVNALSQSAYGGQVKWSQDCITYPETQLRALTNFYEDTYGCADRCLDHPSCLFFKLKDFQIEKTCFLFKSSPVDLITRTIIANPVCGFIVDRIMEQAQETTPTSTTTTTPSTTSKETTTTKKETRIYNSNYFSPASSYNSYYYGHQYENKKRLSPVGPFMWHDEFNSLNPQRWKQTVSASAHIDNSFQYFSSNKENSFVRNGMLYIKPTLTVDRYGENFLQSGRLDLFKEGCDSEKETCVVRGSTKGIIHPVASAQITSENSFNFTYGTIEIRAKMPKGDWISAGINLKPSNSRVGIKPGSGEIKIASVRGNKRFNCNGLPYGRQMVTSGLSFESSLNDKTSSPSLSLFEFNEQVDYSSDFHLYRLNATADGIKFFIDDQLIGEVEAHSDGDPFHFAMNVKVGGKDFPTDCDYGPAMKTPLLDHPHPKTHFWEMRDSWIPTWDMAEDDSALQIDYIRVYY